jgi:hypothetical protein
MNSLIFLSFVVLQKGRYTMPHDSTTGVPHSVFIGFWIVILLFSIRIAWEFRDKIFIRNDVHTRMKKTRSQEITGKK